MHAGQVTGRSTRLDGRRPRRSRLHPDLPPVPARGELAADALEDITVDELTHALRQGFTAEWTTSDEEEGSVDVRVWVPPALVTDDSILALTPVGPMPTPVAEPDRSGGIWWTIGIVALMGLGGGAYLALLRDPLPLVPVVVPTSPDAAVPDAAVPDAALPDAALPDAALPDARPVDADRAAPVQVDATVAKPKRSQPRRRRRNPKKHAISTVSASSDHADTHIPGAPQWSVRLATRRSGLDARAPHPVGARYTRLAPPAGNTTGSTTRPAGYSA